MQQDPFAELSCEDFMITEDAADDFYRLCMEALMPTSDEHAEPRKVRMNSRTTNQSSFSGTQVVKCYILRSLRKRKRIPMSLSRSRTAITTRCIRSQAVMHAKK